MLNQPVKHAHLGEMPAPAANHGSCPLAVVGCGGSWQVCAIKGNENTRLHLQGLGFVPGSEVCVVNEINGNLIASVKGARVALSRQMAAKIMVCSA